MVEMMKKLQLGSLDGSFVVVDDVAAAAAVVAVDGVVVGVVGCQHLLWYWRSLWRVYEKVTVVVADAEVIPRMDVVEIREGEIVGVAAGGDTVLEYWVAWKWSFLKHSVIETKPQHCICHPLLPQLFRSRQHSPSTKDLDY